MKESNVEGLANRNGPELCGGGGNTAAEALAGESAGVVLSPEIVSNVLGADRLVISGRQHNARRHGERRSAPAGSEAHGKWLNDHRDRIESTHSNNATKIICFI